jgi:hypothetical protein
MSKTIKPNGPQATPPGDIHARIALEAASLRNLERPCFQDADATPALSAMLDSARTALEQSIPKSFEHKGRTYWLRVAVPMARMIIFDTPTTFAPMAFALSGSEQEFGHEPGH